MSPQTQQPKLLFVLTSHDKMGNTGKPAGWYLPEFAHPYTVLSPHASITITSVQGGTAPLDPASIEYSKSNSDDSSLDFLKTKEDLWKNTEPLEKFAGRAAEFDGIFFVGGHGPMWDLSHNATSHALIADFHSQNKIIAAVCHGPAALAYAKVAASTAGEEEFLLKDTPVTGFSNAEEDNYGVTDAMPFLLEDALNAASGGKFEKAGDLYAPKVVVAKGGKIITGQNPASAEGVGKAILEQLRK